VKDIGSSLEDEGGLKRRKQNRIIPLLQEYFTDWVFS
jgi:hypothetical protein